MPSRLYAILSPISHLLLLYRSFFIIYLKVLSSSLFIRRLRSLDAEVMWYNFQGDSFVKVLMMIMID